MIEKQQVKRVLKPTAIAALALSLLGGLLYAGIRYLGAFDTLVIAAIYLLGAAILPAGVMLAGGMAPSFLAKLHEVLGAVAYGRTVLVQRTDRWELAPAERTRVYIDDQWHTIEHGLDKWSLYAWRPFGVMRYKSPDTLLEVRADTRAERERGDRESTVAADGSGEVTRGGVTRVSPPDISGDEEKWAVDLTRLYSRGLRHVGNIELIEKAEEIASREHASEGMAKGHETVVAFSVLLVIGLAVGAVAFGFV